MLKISPVFGAFVVSIEQAESVVPKARGLVGCEARYAFNIKTHWLFLGVL